MDIVQTLIELMEGISPVSVYLFLAISVFLENVFPPWPSDVIIIFAGFLIARGSLSFSLSLLSIVVGNILGSILMFTAGGAILRFLHSLHKKYDSGIHNLILGKIFDYTSDENMERAHRWFENHGILFVLFSRFFAGIRFFVSIVAGITAMNFTTYLASFTVGVIVWSSILLYGGYALGESWEKVMVYLKLYNQFFFGLLIFLSLGIIFFNIYKTFNKQSGK